MPESVGRTSTDRDAQASAQGQGEKSTVAFGYAVGHTLAKATAVEIRSAENTYRMYLVAASR